jgi:hypothetical protein
MRPFRISIAAMMGLVVAAAIGAAIMRQGLAASAAAVFLCTQAILCLAVVGLVCRDRTERARWLAVNLFGWGYLRLRVVLWLDLPATVFLKSAGSTIAAERTCRAPSWPDPADPRNLLQAWRFGLMVRFCVRRSAPGIEAEDAMHVLLADPHRVSRLRMRCMSYWPICPGCRG